MRDRGTQTAGAQKADGGGGGLTTVVILGGFRGRTTLSSSMVPGKQQSLSRAYDSFTAQ